MSSTNKKFFSRNLVLPTTLIVLLLLFTGFALLYFYIPKYVESKILPRLFQNAGINNFECDVRRIGFTGLDLGGLYIGDTNEPSISVESVRINYSITGLLRKQIDTIIMAGIEVKCKFSNGKFTIQGLDWESFSAEQTPDKKVSAVTEDNIQFPISIGSLKIRNAVLVCSYSGQTHRIPFDLSIAAKEEHSNTFECNLQVYPREQKLILSSRVCLPEKKALLKFYFDSFHLDRFEDVVNSIPCLILSGNVETICNFQSPLGAIEISGQFFTTIEQSNRNGYCPLRILEPVNTIGEFSAKFTRTGEWEFKLSNFPTFKKSDTPIKDCKLRFNTTDIISKFPSVTFSAKGTDSKGKIDFTTELDDFKLVQGNTSIKFSLISLACNTNLNNNFTEGMTDFELKISNTDLSSKYLTIYTPELLLVGDVHYKKDGSTFMNAIANFENTEISYPEYNTKVTGIAGNIPLQWPCENSGEMGNFFVEAIDWKNLKIGAVSGTISQSELGVTFDGKHTSNLLPGLTLNFNGNAGYSAKEDLKTELNFNVTRFNSNLDLSIFTPKAEGILFSGELELDGNLYVNAEGNIKCSMNTIIQNSNLKFERQGFTIEGIDCELSVPELFSIRSSPNQQFHFKKVSFGNVTLGDGKIGFQIESPENIFVENCEFKWCDGDVYTHSMRVPFYGTDYDITLYCNRLKLSKIFDQFGIARAEGSGAINGRIPIRFTNGKLSINNGFLYSTPGKEGIIHVTGTETFDIGIPQNTPQYFQLDFAKEALKNFNYNWVTLSLNTEKDDLIMQMSLNGKPAEPLPFTYNKEIGTFVRMEAGSGHGISYPMELDFNFRFPINKILYYKQGIDNIINNINILNKD